jgi:hypothetical protein
MRVTKISTKGVKSFKIKNRIMIAKHLSPKLKKIVGVVNLPDDFDEEVELHKVLEKKHLAKKDKKDFKTS